MATLNVDGVRLVYEAEGTGRQSIAFVHGWCSKASHWDAQAAAFGPSYRIVRWDRRGMGRSRSDEPASSPDRHAADLAAVLDAEGIERVIVAGHAGGGPSALSFATQYPGRTEGLILIDTQLHALPGPGGPDELRQYLERSCQRLAADGAPYFERLYRSFFGPRAPAAIVDDAVANALSTPLAVAVAEILHMAGDTASMARRVACPVLWVSAQPDDAAAVMGVFADLTIGHVVGSGHFVPLEVPEQLNPMVAAFLADKVALASA
jgi:pimeloyl-ACP methyl ester carboxylesterase